MKKRTRAIIRACTNEVQRTKRNLDKVIRMGFPQYWVDKCQSDYESAILRLCDVAWEPLE